MRRTWSETRWCLPLAAIGLAALLAGCSGGEASKPRETSHIKPLAILYGQYVGRHGGKPPADEAALKKFIDAQESMLQSFGVSDSAELFVSERDGQPYVVLYGPEAAGKSVVAYEQTGVGGMRYVADTLGAVQEVDEARFSQLVPSTP